MRGTRASEVARYLPGLLRYARFLCCSDLEGRRLVCALLDGLRLRPLVLDGDAGPREALFHALHRLWVPTLRAPEPGDRGAWGPLVKLSPRARAVFLLVRLEGFDLAMVAGLLRLDPADAGALLREAEALMRGEGRRRVLIVEDEAAVAIELEALIEELGHETIGPVRTGRQAVLAAAQDVPDLILADVCLGDACSGIDAIAEIRRQMHVPVVYVTAHPGQLADRALRGATYVTGKPLDRRLLTGVIASALAARRA